MSQLILASKNRPDFSVQFHHSNRFGYGREVNFDCSSYFESWDLNFIDVNPIVLDGESVVQQELGDLQSFGMSLKENLDSLPRQGSWRAFFLRNLNGLY